jgi:flagellar assembly factor FliW
MKIQTSRFGELTVKDEEIFYFPEGLLGFGAFKRYFTFENPSGGPFEWLQSTEVANLAFVVCDPVLFRPDYEVKVKREELESIRLKDIADAIVRVIVVVPKGRPEHMTVNLQGPLVFNTREMLAKQLVLPGDKYSTRHRVFPHQMAVGGRKS